MFLIQSLTHLIECEIPRRYNYIILVKKNTQRHGELYIVFKAMGYEKRFMDENNECNRTRNIMNSIQKLHLCGKKATSFSYVYVICMYSAMWIVEGVCLMQFSWSLGICVHWTLSLCRESRRDKRK